MTTFILAAIGLTLTGLAFFLPPFLRKGLLNAPDRRNLNLQLHEERRREIAMESASSDESQRLSEDLDRALLDDLENAPATCMVSGPAPRRWVFMTLVGLIPTLAVVGYIGWGHPELLEKSPMAARDEARKAIQELALKLEANPSDIEGWLLLGQALQSSQRAPEAVKAFEMASRLAPGNLDLLALYAEAIAEGQDGKLDGQPEQIIKAILKENPQHKMALWLGGLAAAEAGDRRTARTLWQRLQSQLPPSGPEAHELDAYLQKLGPDPGSLKAGHGAAGVRLKVTLDPSLKAQAEPDQILFIFARAAEGPPMPLAVIRKTVKDLPVEVTLDDSLAMRPGLEISKYPALILGARISKTGQATPQAGDLEGTTESITPKSTKVYAVKIDRKRP